MTDSEKGPEYEELIVGHFEGGLNEEQEKQLAATLSDSPAARQLFRSHMRLEGRLHSLGRDGFIAAPAASAGDRAAVSDDAVLDDAVLDDAVLGEAVLGEANGASQTGEQKQGAWRSRVWATSTSLAICAAVIVLLTLIQRPPTVNASNVLRHAQQAAAELVDRTYRLTISTLGKEHNTASKELTINVRGGGCFVVQPADRMYIMGSDGENFWLTRQQRGPVWVTNNFRTLAPELQRKIPNRGLLTLVASPQEPLMLEMSSLLRLIERSYDVRLVNSNNTQHHVRATRRPGVRNNARVIDFWADAESGVMSRVEMQLENSRTASFQLVESPNLTADWYHFSSHAEGRKVEHLPAEGGRASK